MYYIDKNYISVPAKGNCGRDMKTFISAAFLIKNLRRLLLSYSIANLQIFATLVIYFFFLDIKYFPKITLKLFIISNQLKKVYLLISLILN
jgi:hypothetical protein